MFLTMNLCSIVIFFSILYLTSSNRGLRSIFWAILGVVALGCLDFPLPVLSWDIFSLFLGISMVNTAMIKTKGADYIAYLAMRCLNRYPSSFRVIAPLLCYFLAFIFGSGSISLLLLPAVVSLSVQKNILPSNLLAVCMVAAQEAVVCSPMSAINIYVWSEFSALGGFNYSKIVALFISGSVAVILGSFILSKFYGQSIRSVKLTDGMANDLTASRSEEQLFASPKEFANARRSFFIFCGTIIAMLLLMNVPIAYQSYCSILQWPVIDRSFFLLFLSAGMMMHFGKGEWESFVQHPAFQAGFLGSLQVLILGTFGTMFISKFWFFGQAYCTQILQNAPALLFFLFLSFSAILYSQSIAARLLLPFIAATQIPWTKIFAAFPALSALYIFPNHGTVSASLSLDPSYDLTTKARCFDHPFIIPNLTIITLHYLILNLLFLMPIF